MNLSIRTNLSALLLAAAAGAVEPGLPSRTAIANIAFRAIGAKNPDPQFRNPDYLAARFLGPRERALLVDPIRAAVDLGYDEALGRLPPVVPVLITSHLLRTRHIDGAMEEALSTGIRQIVILGAGFDSRAYRYQTRQRGVRFFEVDFPPTQEYKKLRVKEILGKLPPHVRWVAMDFNKDDLLTKLKESGYSENAKAFFIWEGVTYYLRESGVRATLDFVRAHSAPGSAIVFDYTDDQNPNLNNPERFGARVGEPMIFGFPRAGVGPFLRSEGLDLGSDLSYSQLYERYARRSDETAAMRLPNPRTNLAGICIGRVPANSTYRK